MLGLRFRQNIFYLYTMLDDRAFELLQSQLTLANEEKASLRKQVNALLTEIKLLQKSSTKNTTELKTTISELSARLKESNGQMMKLNGYHYIPK